ncbi:hypothetical protein OVA24_06790 [Luteolibacter sp. SL250]|uniref:hypothetical protein n=1 Tax=Luteolibacter sp. SL250 TaxID=2995170 RepID=UPI00226D58DB|nr:hypothetical protein [Luteolibacter sp. SL250]WAC21088.1 hypothetical protein OVA24_06790 [Luteolibacter sp. SL250]
MKKKFEMPNIHLLKNHEGYYGKTMEIDQNLTGYSRRVGEAMVRADFQRKTDCLGNYNSTEQQVAWLAKYGLESSGIKVIDQAVIDDVGEQLDRDVMFHEKLMIGSKVVHVKDKRTVLVIRSIKLGEKVKFEGTGKTAYIRMLRKYRDDGDYSKTDIPQEYFRNEWLPA